MGITCKQCRKEVGGTVNGVCYRCADFNEMLRWVIYPYFLGIITGLALAIGIVSLGSGWG